MASRGQTSAGRDQDDSVFVPYTTAQKKLMGVTYLRNVLVSSSQADAVSPLSDAIRNLLRTRHGLVQGEPDDFRVRSLDEIVAVRTRTMRTMALLLSAAAAVSLVVGGVGVMNIMLVSVAERTREIGIRLAVGARQRDVRLQFLFEAVLISAAGGAIGICAGVLLAQALTSLFGWPAVTAPGVALQVFGFAGLTGVFFGWYPADRAAGIDPIDALRFE
jgi:putative ABC transport system permease protein